MPLDPPVLDLRRWSIKNQIRLRFDDLEAFLLLVEMSLTHERASVEADARLTHSFHPEELGELEVERYQDEVRRLAEDFPQTLRASALSMVQAAFEANLLAIGRYHAATKKKAFDEAIWFQKRGRIWGTKRFLENECGMRGCTSYWPKINDYSNVRNAIMHGDGAITSTLKDPESTRAAAKRLQHVEIRGDTIVLDSQAALDFTHAAKFLCFDLLRS